MVRAKKKAGTWKKRDWYPIKAPEIFEEKEIRETPARSKEELIGRTLTIPLNDITGKRNHRNMNVTFKIKNVEGGKALTEVKSFELTRDYIRKNIRKRSSIIETINQFNVDNKELNVTVYAFTVNKTHSSKQKEIRRRLDEKLEEEVKNNDFDTLIQKMMFGKTATELFKNIKTVTPVKRVEITKCEVKRGE